MLTKCHNNAMRELVLDRLPSHEKPSCTLNSTARVDVNCRFQAKRELSSGFQLIKCSGNSYRLEINSESLTVFTALMKMS